MKDFKFDKRAAKYDSGVEGKTSQKFYDLIMQEISLKQGDKVLDVGCGTGALLKRISDTVEIDGYGVDVEENMILEAKKKCQQMQFSIAQCNQLPFEDNSFDAVIACMAYHHFDDKAGFSREAARVLKPGGMLYIADPRFPWPIRKLVNGILKLVRIVGEFFTSKEIEERFAAYGFIGVGAVGKSYAQVVKLEKTE
jgi:ubiquinone/menaquinone biosynthesis C-methylase UbiE